MKSLHPPKINRTIRNMSNYRNIDIKQYSAMFKALSNPNRLQIFNLLTGCCEPGTICNTDEAVSCCVGDLDGQLDIASSTLSHHLKELNHAGLVNMEREGKQILCSVSPATLTQLSDFFQLNPDKYENLNGSKTS